MDQDRKEQHNRLHNREKSDASKLAWKRHHSSYMRGNREKERNYMNKTLYGVAREIQKTMDEAQLITDNIFKLEANISFNNISGGIALKVNEEDKTVSITCTLDETGSGAFGLLNGDEDSMKHVYDGLKTDLINVCSSLDEELGTILAKYGLKPTR